MADDNERSTGEGQEIDIDELLAAVGSDGDPDGPVGEGRAAVDSGPAEGGRARSRALRSRLAGLAALLLGLVGVLVSVVLAILFIVAGFRASSTVERLLAPLVSAVERVETRIDQADDAVDRDGLAAERVPELRARAEGLADVAATADDLLDGIRDHPIYRRLPADLGPLGGAVDDFVAGAERVDATVASTGDGRALSASDAAVVAAELNDLQAGVGAIEKSIEDASGSLRRWIRLGSFAGFLGSLWSAWAQWCLMRRGLLGARGRAL